MTAEPSPARRLLVIGVGSRDRGDDGIGPAVVDALRGRVGAGVTTMVREGDLAVLPLLWEPGDDVVIVDASPSSGELGSLTEVEPDHLVSETMYSTHGFSVADAIHLAQRLDGLPASLRVFAVGARSFAHGPLSRELKERLEPVADELMDRLGLDPTDGR